MRERIAHFAYNISSKGPYTARAGRLVHLRTDFTFTLTDMHLLGDIIDSLHPTPAVCGIPKDEARRFIMTHESARGHAVCMPEADCCARATNSMSGRRLNVRWTP